MKCYLDADQVHVEAEMLREIFADGAFMNFLQTDLDEGGVFYFCPEILARDLASQMGYRI